MLQSLKKRHFSRDSRIANNWKIQRKFFMNLSASRNKSQKSRDKRTFEKDNVEKVKRVNRTGTKVRQFQKHWFSSVFKEKMQSWLNGILFSNGEADRQKIGSLKDRKRTERLVGIWG